MDFNMIEKCTSMKEVINQIVIENYKISNETFSNKTSVENAMGFYLYANKKQVNSGFDNLFYCFQRSFCKLMEDEKEENIKWDSMILMYSVLINYTDKKYKFKYVPNTVEEFIELIKDMNKSRQICKYLNGVATRLANNSLYCKRSENGNGYSDKKYYYHTQSKPKTVKKYVYINKFELDRTYDLDEGLSSGLDILDKEYLKNGQLDTIETNLEELKLAEESLFRHLIEAKIVTETLYRNIQRKIEEDYKVTFSKEQFMNKIERSEEFNAVAIKNDKICFKGDFLVHGNKLMNMNSLINKFNYLKKIIDTTYYSSEIILEVIIANLDVEVYTEFFRHLKDDRFAKYYVETDNFTLILDTILNEYSAQQKRLKDIYTYNETQRKKKIEKLKELMKVKNNLKSMWEVFLNEFHLKKCKSIKSEEKKRILEYYLGVEIEVKNGKSYIKIC